MNPTDTKQGSDAARGSVTPSPPRDADREGDRQASYPTPITQNYRQDDPRLPVRFRAKILVFGNGCWGWRGHRAMDGSPRYKVGRYNNSAARDAYTWLAGSVPGGSVLRASCGLAHCINPGHQRVVDPRELRTLTARERLFGPKRYRARKPAVLEPRLNDPRLPDRYWDKVWLMPVTGCWEWKGAKDKGGYGQFRVRNLTRRAHRVSFSTLVSVIPDSLVLDHLCRNRACVNPHHLQPVTNADNLLRGVEDRSGTKKP